MEGSNRNKQKSRDHFKEQWLMKLDMNIIKKRNGMDLLAILKHSKIVGNPDRDLKGPASLFDAGPDDFSFCKIEGLEARPLIQRSRAGFLLVHESVPDLISLTIESCLVAMNNPRLGFLRCMNELLAKIHIPWL